MFLCAVRHIPTPAISGTSAILDTQFKNIPLEIVGIFLSGRLK